jgi:hypothetical protein
LVVGVDKQRVAARQRGGEIGGDRGIVTPAFHVAIAIITPNLSDNEAITHAISL